MVRIGIAGDAQPFLSELNKHKHVQYAGNFNPSVNSSELLPWLNSLDGVIFTFPMSDSYTDILEEIVRSGRHSLLTNPYTLTQHKTNPVLKMARESNVICMAGSEAFYNPLVRHTKNEMKLPLFIEAQQLKPFQQPDEKIDVVRSLMLEDIVTVLQIVNSEIKYISASGVKVLSDTIDIANARIEFTNGTLANLTSSRIAQKELHLTRVFQKDCYHVLNFLSNQVDKVFLASSPAAVHPLQTETTQVEKVMPEEVMVSDFIHSISLQQNVGMSLDLSRKALEVCDLILKKINFLGDE